MQVTLLDCSTYRHLMKSRRPTLTVTTMHHEMSTMYYALSTVLPPVIDVATLAFTVV